MKRTAFALLVLVLLLAACAPKDTGPVLKITFGDTEVTYTAADLEALGAVEATVKDVTYLGVPLVVLLEDAGIDPAALTTVQAVASDGFSADYDATIFTDQANLVAYAQVDGPLAEDELPFRMALPEQSGKLNIRMLVEIIAIP